MAKNAELYICLHLTSCEHEIIEQDIINKCAELGIALLYYRQLKEGHVAMYRECKVNSPEKCKINKFISWLDEFKLTDSIVHNPHSHYRKLIKQGLKEEASNFAGDKRLFFNKGR